jgi:hypothetical protein
VNDAKLEKGVPTPLAEGDTLKFAHYTKVGRASQHLQP